MPRRLLLAALLLLAMQPAFAKQDDRQQPMDVHANSSSAFNAPNTVSKLIGNVLITQGTLKGTGDHADLHMDADTQIARVVLFSSPTKQAHIQQLDDNNELMTGDADNIDYDNINGIAVLTGHAVVHQQGHGDAHGDKLTYNTQNDQMNGESSDGNQVHMMFLPKPQPGAPAATPATSPAASPAAAGKAATPPQGH